jgi:alpha-galactosidase/6-phospho-beta-glucosidase family protein
MVVEAALEHSRTKFVDALILDGGVKSPDMAAALADELLEAQQTYLPQIIG